VLVIFAFLRKPWATITPSVTVPLAIVASFGVMYLFGYSLDNLSLMAAKVVMLHYTRVLRYLLIRM
jgi:multidrug efflux pump subunit AcrB